MHSPPEFIFIDQRIVSDCSRNGSGFSRQVPPPIAFTTGNANTNAKIAAKNKRGKRHFFIVRFESANSTSSLLIEIMKLVFLTRRHCDKIAVSALAIRPPLKDKQAFVR